MIQINAVAQFDILYIQTIVSGGRHGELCLWDIRKCQLRETMKAFESDVVVNALVTDPTQNFIVAGSITDPTQNFIVAGSSDGIIKIWSADVNLQLIHCFFSEHAAKSGFSFRQGSLVIRNESFLCKTLCKKKLVVLVAQSTMQGVQQLYIDQELRLYSCGADGCLKFRALHQYIT
ncbi:unnamed protein product [Cylicostephanus goldi]|uniref:Uncharacterized protein n=1 Tax=Cylicostephanus goldi TaxID=71465 RepID=A0A3P7NII0_CYLGO|nr:unnamed protein product [Cylicostephanus goldi]